MSPDEQGFRAWAAARRGHLRRTAFLICLDWDMADDLVQEVLAKVYVRWRRLVVRDRIDAYVRRVLVTTFLDTRRRPWRREVLLGAAPDHQADSAAEAALAAAERSDDRARLVAALAQVPRGQRAVLVLRFFEDLSVDQTAHLLGCTTGTVKSQTARGLAQMRRMLVATPSVGAPSSAAATRLSTGRLTPGMTGPDVAGGEEDVR